MVFDARISRRPSRLVPVVARGLLCLALYSSVPTLPQLPSPCDLALACLLKNVFPNRL